MQEKMLYELVEAIIGKNGIAIVDLLKDKKDVNEFKIAEKLKMTINQTRNILYKLYAQDIVSFIRKKDKSKGWYIYYWTLNTLKALELLRKIKDKGLHEGQNILKSLENKRFYHCKGCEIDLTEETALHHDFLCPECGTLLEVRDNAIKIAETEKRIDKAKREIEIISQEVAKLRVAVEKKHAKRESAEKSKKKKARQKKAKEKASIKKGEEKAEKKAEKKKKALKKKK